MESISLAKLVFANVSTRIHVKLFTIARKRVHSLKFTYLGLFLTVFCSFYFQRERPENSKVSKKREDSKDSSRKMSGVGGRRDKNTI